MEIGTKLKVSLTLSILAVVLKIIVFVGPGWAVIRQDTYLPRRDHLQENLPTDLPQIAVLSKRNDITIKFGIWYYKVCTSDKDINSRSIGGQDDMKGINEPMDNKDERKRKDDVNKKTMQTDKQDGKEKEQNREGWNWKFRSFRAEKSDSQAKDDKNQKCHYKCYNSGDRRGNKNFPFKTERGFWDYLNKNHQSMNRGGIADDDEKEELDVEPNEDLNDANPDDEADMHTKEDGVDDDSSNSNKEHNSKTDSDHTDNGGSQSNKDHDNEDTRRPRPVKLNKNKPDSEDDGQTNGHDESAGQQDDSYFRNLPEQKLRTLMKQKIFAMMKNGHGRGSIRTYIELARKVRMELAVHVTFGLVLGIIGMVGAIRYVRVGGVGKHTGRVVCSTQFLSSFFIWMAVIRAAVCQLNHGDADNFGMAGTHVTAAVPWCLMLGAAGAFTMGLSAIFHLILITRDTKSNGTEYTFQVKSGKVPMIVPKEYLSMTEAGPLSKKQTIA